MNECNIILFYKTGGLFIPMQIKCRMKRNDPKPDIKGNESAP